VSVRSVIHWMVDHMLLTTATLADLAGSGLQLSIWRNLAEEGPATVHELTGRIAEDHQRVRNALYRLVELQAVKCHQRIPSPVGASRPRVVWVALDRSGCPVIGKQRAE